MKQEVFIGIIEAIQHQKEREEKFSEAIKQAYTDAGECPDFRTSESYLPPTSMMVDELVLALAKEFVSENQTYDGAADMINYFLYELPMMGYVFMEPIDPKKNTFEVAPVPAYVEFSNRVKKAVDTPEHLYEALIYGMETVPQAVANHVDTKTELRSAVDKVKAEEDQASWDPVFCEVYNKLKKLVWDKLGVDEWEIKPSSEFTNDLGADSLDEVEIALDVEKEFGISITDYEWDTMCDDIHTMEDAVHAIIKKQSPK